MAKVAVGSIPQKICYVYSVKRDVSVGCPWDIEFWNSKSLGEESADAKIKYAKESVYPTYPTDASDENAISKASQWADHAYENGNRITVEVKKHEVENEPVKNIRLLSLELRSQGGRAYKAVIDDQFYVDLKEDVLMDALLQTGVMPGGKLQGEFIWVKLRSQLKLVRVGSELHRLVLEFDSKKDTKPISKNELEVGGIYQTRKKEKALFLGYVNTTQYTIAAIKDQKKYDYLRQPDFKYYHKNIKKAMLFYELYDYETLEKNLKGLTQPDSDYRFVIKKTHSYLDKINQIELNKNIINTIRLRSLAKIKDLMLEYTGHKAPKQGYAKTSGIYLEQMIANLAEKINMYPFGETKVEPFDVNKYLTYS